MSFKLIMPMAGNGSRFQTHGYTQPKPIIDVNGKPMFVRAVECIDLEFDDYIFIVRKEHNIVNTVKDYYPTAKVVELDTITQGAACSVLTADAYMDNDDSMFISNCDQIMLWDRNLFVNSINYDGVIVTFDCPERDPKWSYAETDAAGNVIRVAEKQPISDSATTGHYYWKSWKTFKDSAEQMFTNNDRYNNEFYLCPVFNYTIAQGHTVKTVNVQRMHGLGTPEDLQQWLDEKKDEL